MPIADRSMDAVIQDHVTPHQLCPHCRHFMWTFDRRIAEHGLVNSQGNFIDVLEFEHLPDIQFLLDSANEGCHLCSILAGRLLDKRQRNELNALGQESLFLELKPRPQAFPALPLYDLQLFSHNPKIWRARRRGRSRALVAASASGRHWSSYGPLVETRVELYNTGLNGNTYITLASRRENGDHLSHCGIHEGRCRWSISTGSDRYLRLIQVWLDQCISQHENCRISPSLELPTRLLDVGLGDDSQNIHLIEGSKTAGLPYATLSWRWGSRLPLMLLPSNIDSFRAGIEYPSLPKTFQDAVFICRKLSIRYLWIDALCIIQGRHGDFETEAAKMESVYAGSFITLGAAEAVDSWDGFLATRDPLQQEDCWVNLKESGPVLKFSRAIPRKYFGEYTLDQRGWVFQERLLSPRSVYFSPHGVEWECRQSTTTTDEFVSSKDILLMGQLSKRIYTPLVQLESLRSSRDLARFQRHWNDVVMQYSRTTLSYDFDKLPALAGAAAIVERKFKIKASFGLWLRLFTNELLWATAGDEVGQQPVRVPGRAPSWSWASIEGAVEKHHVSDKYLFSRTEQEYTAKVVVAPAATSFTKPPRMWEPIKLRGPLVPCILKIHEVGRTVVEMNSPFQINQGATAYVDDDGVYRMRSFSADVDLEIDRRLVCLLVKRVCCSELGGSLSGDGASFTKFVVRDVGLVLAPTGAHCCQYERVGLYDESAEKAVSDSISETHCQLLSKLLRTLGMFPAKSGVQSRVVEIV